MRRVNGSTGTVGVACFVILGCAGIAGLITGLHAHAVPPAGPSPVEIIGQRFPSYNLASLSSATSTGAGTYVVASVANVLPVDELELFSPNPLYKVTATSPVVETAPEPAAQPEEPAEPESPNPAPGKPAPSKREAAQPAAPAAAPVHRKPAGRPGGVLNDAQIANIKQRLKLTPDQEQMWPAVASALRNITYAKNATEAPIRATQPGHAMAYIDPDSAEVRQLKYAALPLIMQLNDDQRREVKMLAHVMGLENMASQF
jgi:hypothetical protein